MHLECESEKRAKNVDLHTTKNIKIRKKTFLLFLDEFSETDLRPIYCSLTCVGATEMPADDTQWANSSSSLALWESAESHRLGWVQLHRLVKESSQQNALTVYHTHFLWSTVITTEWPFTSAPCLQVNHLNALYKNSSEIQNYGDKMTKITGIKWQTLRMFVIWSL